MKRALTTLAVTGLLAAACSGVFGQRYNPPANGRSGSAPPPSVNIPPPLPKQGTPDPFGLTLAASGAAAAAGYIMRRKQRAA